MANRKKQIPPLLAAPAKPTRRKRLLFAIDLGLLVLALALIAGALFSFLTRPLVSYSVTADVAMANCRFQPIPVFDGEQFVDRAPHIHLAVLSMVTTATVIYALEPGSSTPTANSFTPLGPQSFAVLSCAPEASVRVFLVPKRTMTILKGGAFTFLDKGVRLPTAVPKNYSVGLAFDYPNGSKVWTIMASQKTDIHAATFEYGPREPIPLAAMEGALFEGQARSFENAPAVLDRGLLVPAAGQRTVIRIPGGIKEDYEPMIFVTTRQARDLLSEAPIDCEAVDVTDPKGTVIVDGNARSVDGAHKLSSSDTSAELRFAPTATSLSVLIRGSSRTILLDGVQLVPSRAGRFGLQEPLVAGTVGTLLAALITVLFVTRGRAVHQWLNREL